MKRLMLLWAILLVLWIEVFTHGLPYWVILVLALPTTLTILSSVILIKAWRLKKIGRK